MRVRSIPVLVLACFGLQFPSLPAADVPAGSETALKIAEAALLDVETLSRKAASLEDLGKKTLSQSVTLMDLGADGLPVLIPKLETKDWKLRYWITDMLGYTGNAGTLPVLLRLAGDGQENLQVRSRALDSMLEIVRRDAGCAPGLKKELEALRKRTRSRKFRSRVAQTLENLP